MTLTKDLQSLFDRVGGISPDDDSLELQKAGTVITVKNLDAGEDSAAEAMIKKIVFKRSDGSTIGWIDSKGIINLPKLVAQERVEELLQSVGVENVLAGDLQVGGDTELGTSTSASVKPAFSVKGWNGAQFNILRIDSSLAVPILLGDHADFAAGKELTQVGVLPVFAHVGNAGIHVTSGEKGALAGTTGTPSGANKYVTDSDARNTNTRVPTLHASSHQVGGTDQLAVTGLLGVLADLQKPRLDQDILANRPAAAVAGRLFRTTDESIVYRDSGTAWDKVAVTSYASLSGVPGAFTPVGHAGTHMHTGTDEMNVAGMLGRLADSQFITVKDEGTILGQAHTINIVGSSVTATFLSGEATITVTPGSAPAATNVVQGVSRLTLAAASPADPIAVGDNDTRLPTQDENDALQGTNGAPSATNRYVTNTDPRNINNRTPTAHASTHQTGGSDQLVVTGLSGLLADPQVPTLHAASHQSGGTDQLSHSVLAGLSADDHSQYSLVTGVRAYTGPIGGVNPTSSAHLTPRGFTDLFAGPSVNDQAGLAAIAIADRADGQVRFVRLEGAQYHFDAGATSGGITPTFGTGRWFPVAVATSADHEALIGLLGGDGTGHFHLNASQYNDLTGNQNVTFHHHDSDRDRANHTGTQLRATISNFSHASTHQSGGADEINVAGLVGLLADIQKVEVRDEGTSQGSPRRLNFVGGGVIATVTGDTATITITGSGPGSSVAVAKNGTNVVTSASVLNFSSVFDVTQSPAGQANVILNAGQVTGTMAAGDDNRFPAAGEKAALAGTDGTPSNANRYVTNTDVRNTNARVPTAHSASHASTGSDPLSHSTLLNLSADDHPQYLKTDGTRDLGGPIKSPAPTDPAHLTRKDFVTGLTDPLYQRIHAKTQTLVTLVAIAAVERFDGLIVLVEDEGQICRFDTDAVSGGIIPNAGTGRWFKLIVDPQAHDLTTGLLGGATGERYHLSQAQFLDLTGSGNSTSHHHDSDRARANHTGTQLRATISDFPHKTTHQSGGTDEINVAGLIGRLSDSQFITARDEGTNLGQAHTVDVVGAGASASLTTGVLTITVNGGITGVTVKKDDAVVIGNTTTIDFGGGQFDITESPTGEANLTIKDATTTLKAAVKLSTAPALATAPIAVGDNDPRNTNARTPTVHATTHQAGGTDVINVTGLAGRLAGSQFFTVKDEGTDLGLVHTVDFVGAQVSVNASLSVATVSIPADPNASASIKGVSKLSLDPVDLSDPIAAGTNDPRIPSQPENDAMQGTSGSPSNSNRFVTNTDTRLADSRIPTAHVTTHQLGGSDVLDVTGLAGRLSISQFSTIQDEGNAQGQAHTFNFVGPNVTAAVATGVATITVAASSPDASTTVKGLTKLSVAAALATNPIAVGDNDPRMPSATEKSAMQGTSGTPSNTNRFVTDADSRNTDSRTPTAHKISHQVGGSDQISVAGLLGRLNDNQFVLVKDEGASQGNAHTIDFVGAGVSAAVSSGVATIVITGGGGGGGTMTVKQDGTIISTVITVFDFNAFTVTETPAGQANITVKDASTSIKGVAKLSVAPVSASIPIAVGDNDSRMSNARTPTAHAASHQLSGSDEINVAGLTGRLAGNQFVLIQDEGTSLNNAHTLNFVGAAVTAVVASSVATITVTSPADASSTVKGITKLSVDPVASSIPIAVGDNDNRVPTQNENDALQGTSGAVSNSNRFVTDADSRNTNARTPTAHKTSHQSGGSDELSVTGLIGRLNDSQFVTVKSHGTSLGQAHTIDFTGSTSASLSAGVATVTASGGGGSSLNVKADGSFVDTADTLNFNGFDVTETPANTFNITTPLATDIRNGLMRSSAVIKLDSIEAGAQVNSTIMSGATIVAFAPRATSFNSTAFSVTESPTFQANITLNFGDGAGQPVQGTNTRIPTQGQTDALAGTSGMPSNANRFVTDADARNTNARTPTAHAASHKNGGSDEVSTATAAANAIPKAGAGGTLAIGWIPTSTSSSATAVPRADDARLSNARTPTAHAATHESGGTDPISSLPTASQKLALPGTSGTPSGTNKYVTDADSRNTNARTPTAHATTHEVGGTDEISVAGLAGQLSDRQKVRIQQAGSDIGTVDTVNLVSGATAVLSGSVVNVTVSSSDKFLFISYPTKLNLNAGTPISIGGVGHYITSYGQLLNSDNVAGDTFHLEISFEISAGTANLIFATDETSTPPPIIRVSETVSPGTTVQHKWRFSLVILSMTGSNNVRTLGYSISSSGAISHFPVTDFTIDFTSSFDFQLGISQTSPQVYAYSEGWRMRP